MHTDKLESTTTKNKIQLDQQKLQTKSIGTEKGKLTKRKLTKRKCEHVCVDVCERVGVVWGV